MPAHRVVALLGVTLLRDLTGAAEVYPDAVWPTQISDALRELIHQANLAREQDHNTIDDDIRDKLITRFRAGGTVPTLPVLERLTRSLGAELTVQLAPSSSVA